MFRPLDTAVFDTDWPLVDGRVHNLRDIGVTVHNRPSGAAWPVPSEIVVTGSTASSITVAIASREDLTPYSGTAITLTGIGDTGGIYRASNSVMTVTVTTAEALTPYVGSPIQVMPSCVMWLVTEDADFNMSVIPTPRYGWSRVIDYGSRRIVYTANEPRNTGTPTDGRLRLVNGLSSPVLPFVADGQGQIEITNDSITIKPAERTDP